MKGTIKTLKENGFGFIKADGMEKDLFFHRNGLVGVEFDEQKTLARVFFVWWKGKTAYEHSLPLL